MKKFLQKFSFFWKISFTVFFLSSLVFAEQDQKNPNLKVYLSPGNLPTQKINPGDKNIEILRFLLKSEKSSEIGDPLLNGIKVDFIKIERVSDYDLNQILRYKLQYQNNIISKISLADSDVLNFKNLDIFIPFDSTVEIKIIADISFGEFFGKHFFQITDKNFIGTKKSTILDPDIIVSGAFPIKANKIIVGKEEKIYETPTEECNLREEPVCGDDGKTYYNYCIAYHKNVKILYQGQCNRDDFEHLQSCQKDFEPVCGDDGKSYNNECFLNKANVNKKHNGKCFPKTYDPKTLLAAIELLELRINELLELRFSVLNDSKKTFDDIVYVLKNYAFVDEAKEQLIKDIVRFLDFSNNLSSQETLEKEIELLNLNISLARSQSARQKYEYGFIPFIDVEKNEWFFEPVRFLKQKNWVQGYKNADGEDTGLFRPENKVTKAEATKMIFQASGILDNWDKETPDAENVYAKKHWAYSFIALGEKFGISLWDDFSNPDKKITRSEVIKLIFDIFVVDPPKNFPKNSFPDVPVYHENFRYIEHAKSLEIISGYPDGKFYPNESISRAEIAKVITNSFEKLRQLPLSYKVIPQSLSIKKNEYFERNSSGVFVIAKDSLIENKQLFEADIESFEPLKYAFAKDKNRLYFFDWDPKNPKVYTWKTFDTQKIKILSPDQISVDEKIFQLKNTGNWLDKNYQWEEQKQNEKQPKD